MALETRTETRTRYRVADFAATGATFEFMPAVEGEDPAVLAARLRTYADLPFVYVLAAHQVPLVLEILARLKAIRSPCYPYALFIIDPSGSATLPDLDAGALDLDIFHVTGSETDHLVQKVAAYGDTRFQCDKQALQRINRRDLPETVDVVVVGAGVTGLYAARRLKEEGLRYCVLDERDMVGGIWSKYANSTSQVNSSEGAYRLIEKQTRCNRDHSTTREILEDVARLAEESDDRLYLQTRVERVRKAGAGYEMEVSRNQQTTRLHCKGAILAINDRVGAPREIHWKDEGRFQGPILSGFADGTAGFDWRGKQVAIVGMGAFAVENARTALEGGADHVTVICRRHGTVCPKIIDYLNFATPYDEEFKHPRKSNMRNMLLWKNLYKRSGATEPECWMGKIKHDGHTISVSDIWFIAHHLKKLHTVKGTVAQLEQRGVRLDQGLFIEADVLVNCVGFQRNAPVAKGLSEYAETYNINYLDKDLMYLADAFIDDNAFNSFFGSSVLEMAKFYLEVYLQYFNTPAFDALIGAEGIHKVPIEERCWSHYIQGAEALVRQFDNIHEIAARQVARRTRNFLEVHDLTAYLAENKREWIDTHSLLAGRPMRSEACLKYVFDKLLDEK